MTLTRITKANAIDSNFNCVITIVGSPTVFSNR